jgi:alpha/beta superfamily hydrolase
MDTQQPCENDYLGEILTIRLEDGTTTDATVGYLDNVDTGRMLVVLPPHPSLGGDADNNVVDALFRTAVQYGMLALKFNYRGVVSGTVGDEDLMTYWDRLDDSGDYGVVEGDVVTTVTQVCEAFGVSPTLLSAGYSFGSWIALRLADVLSPAAIAGISPPIADHAFGPLLAPGCRLTVFVAEDDVFCPVEAMRDLASGRPVEVVQVSSEDHFFRGCERELAERVMRSLAYT